MYYWNGVPVGFFDWSPTWLGWCPVENKPTRVIESGSYRGFAGGLCFYDILACGHSFADETADVLAAM